MKKMWNWLKGIKISIPQELMILLKIKFLSKTIECFCEYSNEKKCFT